MASMQDRLKLKRPHCDAWTAREQLCLASSVLKSGDQNWMSVSRSLKPFIEKESLRPPDWFSQKSCAMQYASLLENVDTPKRKKRESGETTSESIVKRLTNERLAELKQVMAQQKEEYLRLKTELDLLRSGVISDDKLEKMWLEIQQDERETEQKTLTQMTWLAKRQQQQKQEINSPSASTLITSQTRKLTESTAEVAQESTTAESSAENDDEKKSNRGGRSPLLTSLLKSPSPTTQTMQAFPSTPTQVSSPTITSLLGSSPKVLNSQLAQNVSPQLQQLVSTAIASVSTTSERPSVGAPTLSMLLEMPASAQRGPLPNLQSTTNTTIVSQQQQQQTTASGMVATTEAHNFQQAAQTQSQVHQVTVQNEANAAATTAPVITAITTASTNIPVSENMVQIIDQIDDVICKDMMTNVMDKDEINEIIGDIEELIKEEITCSPQAVETGPTTTTIATTTTTIATTMATTTTTAMAASPITIMTTATTTTMATAVINDLADIPQQMAEIAVAPEPKSEPRDVDDVVSISDSPQSEMAIEEIDSSTSNIAEIIGTVAIEPQEPKIIVAEITETVSHIAEETKSETNSCKEKMDLTEELALETNDEENSKDATMEEKEPDIEIKSTESASNVEIEKTDSKIPDEVKETIEETVKEEIKAEDEEKEKKMEASAPDEEPEPGSIKERKESIEDTEGNDDTRLARIEMHLAKIAGNQQDIPSAEIISVSSEMTNDLPSTEDTEKSQDISLVLEDDENSQSSEAKKKTVTEEQINENTVESTESMESFKKESVVPLKEETTAEVKEESSMKSQEEGTVEKTLEIYTNEFKKEEVKDFSEDTTSSILQDIEVKEEEIDSEPIDTVQDVTHVMTIAIEDIKSEPTKTAVVDADAKIKKIESVDFKPEELKTETEPAATGTFDRKNPSKEDKKENVELKVEKEEKEDTKKSADGEQSIKKEIESAVGEGPGELNEEESSLSKLSGGRAMKTYSKKQNIAVDSEPENDSEGSDYRTWKKAVMLVYNRLSTHKFASLFLKPITEDQAPGYHSMIFRPMDLSTIKKNIDNGTIRTTMHFQRDVMLMFQNAIMYNKHDTIIYEMAVLMQEECLQHLQLLVQITGDGTLRRETRTAASSSSETSEGSIVKRKRSHITPSPYDTDNPRSKKRRKSEND